MDIIIETDRWINRCDKVIQHFVASDKEILKVCGQYYYIFDFLVLIKF